MLWGICVVVLIVISRVLVNIRNLLPIDLILSWCSTLARNMSQSSAIKIGLTIPGLVICSVTMSAWLLTCVVSILLLIWCTAVIVVTVVLLIATVIVTSILIVFVSIVAWILVILIFGLFLHFVFLIRDY